MLMSFWRARKRGGSARLAVLALGCSLATIGAATPGPIPYASMQVISNGDSDAVIAEKAAKVLPRPNQMDWMRLERTFFVHFGVNTFSEVEWGSGREDPAIFNPTALDANQWLDAMQHFGGQMIVLVCKHHDGFCLWPTRYTAHSVAASPWRGGQGDLVREVANAARAHGLKLAVYLSPADLYQLRTNPKNPAGYYGNGSSNVPSVIPTDPASFKTNPAKGRASAPGFSNYTYVVDDYNRYFLNQLYELLTQYGPIQEVWFDGANPDPSVHETYNYAACYDLIRHLHPGAVIMGKGPDVRWVGNESGLGRATEWSVIPLPAAPDHFNWPDMQASDLGSRARLKPGSHLWWYPAEVNTTILQNNQWFWARNKQPRTVTQLVDIFYTSVGRNGNLLLNLSPDQRGLIPDNQLEALNRTAQIINHTFATNLAKGGKATADNANPTNSASLALDGDLDTWWEAAPGKTNGTVTLALPKPVTFDVVSLQEAADHRGQRIESFVIETWNGAAWVNAETVSSGELTTVGHRRLIRLKTPVTTDQVRLRITGSRLEPTLAEMGLFKQSEQVSPERARANFARPIVLRPDDVRAFPDAPAGFDAPRAGGLLGHTEVFKYDSTVTGTRRKAVVYLPPRYSSDRRYPVLYLLHGIGGNEWEWSGYVHADTIIDHLIVDGKATPMIVVMPNGRALADDRVPPPDRTFSPQNAVGFAKFERDLLDCLIPAIQAKYSTCTDREHRALAGLSMGGGQTLNFGFGHLDTFAWLGGFSSAPNTRPPAELAPDPASARERLKLLYLSCGSKDGLINISQGIHVYLKQHHVPHVWNVDGHGHDRETWGNNLYHFAQRVFR
jgi:alpha-L-fucosidase